MTQIKIGDTVLLKNGLKGKVIGNPYKKRYAMIYGSGLLHIFSATQVKEVSEYEPVRTSNNQ